jgi:hypothetical protein
MVKARLRAAGLLLTLLSVATANGTATGEYVDNFALLDQSGKFHELHYLSDMKAVVLMAHDEKCGDMANAVAKLEQVKARYDGQGIEFLLLNTTSDQAALRGQSSSIPILIDEARLVGPTLRFTHAAEIFVIDPKGWKLAYRGPMERGRSSQSGALLNGALDAMLAGQPLPRSGRAGGCKMKDMKTRPATARDAYATQVAPILIDRCVTCHREGGIGPWQMANYDIVRGFAPMMREVIRTRRMPPWHADPHIGTFEGDRSLRLSEMQTLVSWIEAGAPRGKGADPLAALRLAPEEWTFGKPDLILEAPAFEVPATGSIDYQRHTIKNPTGRDLWLRASDVLPGDRAVLHHVLVGMDDVRLGERERRLQGAIGSIGLYVPGGGPFKYPADTGVFVPKDASFTLQMHYTASGKTTRDVTRIGLYFAAAAPKYELKTLLLAKPTLRIPANTKDHTESASRAVPRDVMVYSFFPHAHFRGRASSFAATYPDGRRETLLSVPRYDFNWQATYSLTEPKVIPAGTRITHTTTYDNSTQNKANPDADRVVPFGEQSWDEMLYGTITYRELTDSPTRTAQQESSADQAVPR